MRKRLLTILCLTLCSLSVAQTVSQIKADPAYLWAEGKGDTKSHATVAALDALSVRLAATNILGVDPARRKALWQTYLPDLKDCSSEVEISSFSCLRYIAWEDIPSVFNARWRKVRELTESAQAALSRGAEDEARTYCHWAEIYLASLPDGEESLRNRVEKLKTRLGSGNVSAVKMKNIERETAAISRALGGAPTAKILPPAKQTSPSAADKSPTRDMIVLQSVISPPAFISPLPVIPPALQPYTSQDDAAIQAQASRSRALQILALSELGRVPAFGLQFVWHPGSFGLYLSARSNFNFTKPAYSCKSDGVTEFGYIWPSGKTGGQRSAGSIGAVFQLNDMLDVYVATGYGRERLLWGDTSDRWADVTDLSHRGAIAETGVLLYFKGFSFSAGVSTIAFSQISAQLGFGMAF